MRYKWDGSQFVDRDGRPMVKPYAGQICTPTVIPDIPDYRSPVDGRVISGRAGKRDDLKRHNCIDARELPSPTGGKFRNKRFCAKYNLPLAEEYR